LTEQAIGGLKGETVFCEKGLIEFGGKCVPKGQCGKSGQRPCLLTERIPSCDRGLAEDFKAGKCDTPKSFAQVCEDVVEAVQQDRSIAIIERLKKEKDRLLGEASDASGLTKIKEDAGRVIKAQMRDQQKRFRPFLDQLGDLTDEVSDNIANIQKAFLSPKPFCNDTGAQRLAKLKKLNLLPTFAERKKAGLLDGLFIKSAYANTKPTYYWGFNVDFGGIAKGVWVNLSITTVFESDLNKPDSPDKVVAVATSLGVPFSEPAPFEFGVGYTYFGTKGYKRFGRYVLNADSFTGMSWPSFGVGIPGGALTAFLDIPELAPVKKKMSDPKIKTALDWFSLDFGIPLLDIYPGERRPFRWKVIDSIGASFAIYPFKPDPDDDINPAAGVGLINAGIRVR
jgi:hypothetical protein